MRFDFPRKPSAVPFLVCLSAILALAAPDRADSSGVERLDPADAAPAHEVLPVTAPLGRAATGNHFEVQVGAARWKWNEVVPGRSQLEELGLVPVFVARGEWWRGPVLLGASVDMLLGAVAYEGYLQDKFDGSLVPYESNTHYLVFTPTVNLQFQGSGAWRWIRPTLSLSRPWWRRTIDSEVDRSPGRFGYVETWSILGSGFGLELERTFRRIHAISVFGELLVPLSTSEKVGSGPSPVALKPKTRNGSHWRARYVYGHRYVMELEAFRTGFDESDPVDLGEGTGLRIYQPESSLDRVAWKAGMIF